MRHLIDAAVAELVAAYVAAARAQPVSEPLYGLAAYGYYDGYEVGQLALPFTGQRVADRDRLLADGRLDDLFDESQGVHVPAPDYQSLERMSACVALYEAIDGQDGANDVLAALCHALTRADWQGALQVTDDFMVVAAVSDHVGIGSEAFWEIATPAARAFYEPLVAERRTGIAGRQRLEHDVLLERELADGRTATVHRAADGRLMLSADLLSGHHYVSQQPISSPRPARLRLGGGARLLGGLMPDGAASVEVVGLSGQVAQATTGAGVWMVDDPDPTAPDELAPRVRARDRDGELVPLPVDGETSREAAALHERCPACDGTEWDHVEVGGGQSWLVCRACGSRTRVASATMTASGMHIVAWTSDDELDGDDGPDTDFDEEHNILVTLTTGEPQDDEAIARAESWRTELEAGARAALEIPGIPPVWPQDAPGEPRLASFSDGGEFTLIDGGDGGRPDWEVERSTDDYFGDLLDRLRRRLDLPTFETPEDVEQDAHDTWMRALDRERALAAAHRQVICGSVAGTQADFEVVGAGGRWTALTRARESWTIVDGPGKPPQELHLLAVRPQLPEY